MQICTIRKTITTAVLNKKINSLSSAIHFPYYLIKYWFIEFLIENIIFLKICTFFYYFRFMYVDIRILLQVFIFFIYLFLSLSYLNKSRNKWIDKRELKKNSIKERNNYYFNIVIVAIGWLVYLYFFNFL